MNDLGYVIEEIEGEWYEIRFQMEMVTESKFLFVTKEQWKELWKEIQLSWSNSTSILFSEIKVYIW